MILKESDISTRVQELLVQKQTRRQVLAGLARNVIKGGLLIGGTTPIIESTLPFTLEMTRIFKEYQLQERDWEIAGLSNEEFVEVNKERFRGTESGTTFVPERIGPMGLSNTHENEEGHNQAREVLKIITNDYEDGGLGFGNIRFCVRWSSVVDEDGNNNFSRYDSLFDILVNKKIKILLETGVKSAGWKEDWIPGAVVRKLGVPPQGAVIQADSPISTACVEFVSALNEHLIERYGKNIVDLVVGVQPENEPFQQFGEGQYTMSFGHLRNMTKEFRKSFPRARICVNTAPYTNLDLVRDYFEELKRGNEDLSMYDTGFDLYPLHPDIKRFLEKYFWKFPDLLDFKPDQITLASIAPGYSFSDHLKMSEGWGSGTETTELQDEPWDPEMLPGNSARFARYAFLRSWRFRIPGKPFVVREWGSQRHAKFKLNDLFDRNRGKELPEPRFTAEHRQIYDLYHRIKSLQAA